MIFFLLATDVNKYCKIGHSTVRYLPLVVKEFLHFKNVVFPTAEASANGPGYGHWQIIIYLLMTIQWLIYFVYKIVI
jgi:hypothetical protein